MTDSPISRRLAAMDTATLHESGAVTTMNADMPL